MASSERQVVVAGKQLLGGFGASLGRTTGALLFRNRSPCGSDLCG